MNISTNLLVDRRAIVRMMTLLKAKRSVSKRMTGAYPSGSHEQLVCSNIVHITNNECNLYPLSICGHRLIKGSKTGA